MAAGDPQTSIPRGMEIELETSRQTAARLLDALSRKMASTRAGRYLDDHPVRAIAEEVQRAVRRRPVYAVVAAALAGYVVGRILISPAGSRKPTSS